MQTREIATIVHESPYRDNGHQQMENARRFVSPQHTADTVILKEYARKNRLVPIVDITRANTRERQPKRVPRIDCGRTIPIDISTREQDNQHILIRCSVGDQAIHMMAHESSKIRTRNDRNK